MWVCPLCHDCADLDEEMAHKASHFDALVELRRRFDEPLSSPFLSGVTREIVHQELRWRDEQKAPPDWFWTLSYLATKALLAHTAGDREKALHHAVTSAALLGNWHAAIERELT